MKRVPLMVLLVMALAGLLMAQQGTAPQTQPAQTPAAAQQPAAPAAAPAKTPPQAKSQDEFKAYQEASASADAAAMEKAADDFSAKFKDSELRYLLYYRAMSMYQMQNNAEKAIDMGRRVLAIRPNEPVTLAMVANFLAMKTRDTDLDRDDRLKEAMQDAEKSLQTVETDLMVPPGTPAETVEANKNLLRSVAYSAIGNVYASRNDYPQAEVNLKKSLDLAAAQPDAITWLQYSIALDRQKKYQEALTACNKALDIAPAGSPQAELIKRERQRLLQLTGAPAAAPAQPATPAPPATPAQPASPPQQPPK